jgi:hypothetical protein
VNAVHGLQQSEQYLQRAIGEDESPEIYLFQETYGGFLLVADDGVLVVVRTAEQ